VFVGFVDRDGTDLVRLNSPDPTLNLGCGAWSRDGSTFACEAWDDDDPSRRGIYTVSAEDGGGLRRLTTAPPDAQDAPCDFAPDGSRLYFIRINILAENESELMVVNLDGTGGARLIDAPVSLRCRLSPEGQTLLVEAAGQILVVPLDDLPDGVHTLSVDVPRGSKLGHPAWSPDGAHIAFSASTPGQPLDLWVAEPNGDNATNLTDTPDIHEWLESWGP
jgi:Tol biopolymer transport system component